jgi:outer membrane biosynthesis protein TonB
MNKIVKNAGKFHLAILFPMLLVLLLSFVNLGKHKLLIHVDSPFPKKERPPLPVWRQRTDSIPRTGNILLDTVLIKVEIEAEYPGGLKAWSKYLVKHLRYPDAAARGNIMGDIIVQFIVDKDGHISNITAISGPEELKAESIRIIKESGKWIPALQNGQKVNSYKRQPIKFRLG